MLVEITNMKRSVVTNADGLAPTIRHKAIRIVLKSGRSYVVDVTGAQFGHHSLVCSLEDYMTSRGARIIEFFKLEWYKVQILKDIAQLEGLQLVGPHEMYRLAAKTRAQNYHIMVSEVEIKLTAWLQARGTTLAALMSLKKGPFDNEFGALTQHLTKIVDECVSRGMTKGDFITMVAMVPRPSGHAIVLRYGNGIVREVPMKKATLVAWQAVMKDVPSELVSD